MRAVPTRATDRPAGEQLVGAWWRPGDNCRPPTAPSGRSHRLEMDGLEESRDLTELPGRPRILFDGGAGDLRPTRHLSAVERSRGPTSPAPAALPTRPPPERIPSRPGPPFAVANGPSGATGRRHRWRWPLILLVVLVIAGGLGVVAIRLSKPFHPVPALVGRSVADAGRALQPLHLHLRVHGQVFDERVPKGLISAQRPAPSKREREGSAVSVVLSAGPPPCAVPDLTGLTADQANQRLIGAGFTAGPVVNRSDNTVPAGVVVS